MNSQTLYTRTTPALQDHALRYRYIRTMDLLSEEESRRWELAEIMDELERDPTGWAYPAASVDYVATALRDIRAELERRQRLRHRPEAPAWPQHDAARYERLKGLATSLKALVPIDRYCELELGLTLRKMRDGFITACPFVDHPDTTPSFSISSSKALFHCFGCRRGGDVFVLAGQLNGLDRFEDQVMHIATVAGVTEGVTDAG